jgi:succinate dehydrogenase / fumarate reductase membrane anchor subunit
MKLKWEDHGLKSPLGRARGLGSAGHGSSHWMAQRITSIANLPLVGWFAFAVVDLKGASHAVFTSWLAEPINAILAILFIISVCYHAKLGSQVVVEDYVHNEGLKFLKLIGLKLFFFGLAIACIFSILKIAL